MAPSPTVLYPLTLPSLLQHVRARGYSTLVICASRDTFLQDLLQSLESQAAEHDSDLQDLVTPSLYNLSTVQNINVAFCASVPALLAYLTAYGRDRPSDTDKNSTKRLMIVNPLALHAPTPSFSAQGLSRIFAAAAETALRTSVMLHIVECKSTGQQFGDDDEDMVMNHSDEDGVTNTDESNDDPWAQEVPILNVSARRFGSGSGERTWAGRTVKAKRIAAKWFLFQQIEMTQRHERQG